MVCAIVLLRDLHAHVKPPPLPLDFLLVESEPSSPSTSGQASENESPDSELAEPEFSSQLAQNNAAEQPLDTLMPAVQPLDANPIAADPPQEIARPMTRSRTAEMPKPVMPSQPRTEPDREGIYPTVSTPIDTQSPPPPYQTVQEQTVTDTTDELTGDTPANPSPPTLETASSDQAATEQQASPIPPPSTQSSAHASDSSSLSQNEAAESLNAQSATAAGNQQSAMTRTSSSRSDYSWLTATLRRRVESLKTYPHLARVQGWGGRVVVRATIKDDGSLLDARVVESSGYEILDNEAIQLMHRAFPIHLQRDIGKPQVAVMVPIQYRSER
ncbi:hypothetical protein W02_38040 [Nitrospira sp. KM1]|nr:hypothetical protein W02_38040 [Nitrospira sp. KM1]